MSKPAPAEAIPDIKNEILTSREPYFATGISLDTHYMFCFDERGVAYAETTAHDLTAVTPDEYLHAAGGGLNISFNHAVLDEANEPFSVKDSFGERAGKVMPVLIKAGVKPGVHSDVGAEGGNLIKAGAEGIVGCGYAEKRPIISAYIADNGAMIVRDAYVLRPELFQEPANLDFAHAVVAAHDRLIHREGFMTPGRRVVMTAASRGAGLMLVEGEHTGETGIINLVTGTTFDSDGANGAGLEAYDQDSWAVEQANDRIRDEYPYDPRQQQIAELIDSIGTMRALGVKDIVVRR